MPMRSATLPAIGLLQPPHDIELPTVDRHAGLRHLEQRRREAEGTGLIDEW